MNPFRALLQSRKFWLMVADAVIALLTYFVGKYVPAAADDLKFLTVTLQPVIIAVIVGIAVEDVGYKIGLGQADADAADGK